MFFVLTLVAAKFMTLRYVTSNHSFFSKFSISLQQSLNHCFFVLLVILFSLLFICLQLLRPSSVILLPFSPFFDLIHHCSVTCNQRVFGNFLSFTPIVLVVPCGILSYSCRHLASILSSSSLPFLSDSRSLH